MCAAAASGDYGRKEVTIRANGLDTPWHADDLRAIAEAGPAAVVVPKINSAADVAAVEKALEAGGAPTTPASGPCSRRRSPSCTPRRSPPRASGWPCW